MIDSYGIHEDLSEKLSSSSDSGKADSPLTNPEDQILKPASEILEKAWSYIMSSVTNKCVQTAQLEEGAKKQGL